MPCCSRREAAMRRVSPSYPGGAEGPQVFVAGYALDQTMVDAVFKPAADGRRTEAIQPAGEAQAGLHVVAPQASRAARWPSASATSPWCTCARGWRARISRRSASRTPWSSPRPASRPCRTTARASPARCRSLIRDKLRLLPTANGLLAKRYADGLTLAQIATCGRDPAELAAALAMARAAPSTGSPAGHAVRSRRPRISLLIEEFIAGTIAYDIRLGLAESLLSDIGRTAGFIRQVRLDLVLTACAQEPRPPQRLPVAEPPRSRTSTCLPMPANGIPSTHELHRPPSAAGRLAKNGPAGSSTRLVLIAGGALLVLAVIAGGFTLSSRPPAAHPAHAPAGNGSPPSSSAIPVVPAAEKPPDAVARRRARPHRRRAVRRLRIDSGQVTRAGGRYLLKAGAQLAAGARDRPGPWCSACAWAGAFTSIGVTCSRAGSPSAMAMPRWSSSAARRTSIAPRARTRSGWAWAMPSRSAMALLFTVTTTDDGMRLEVARGRAQRSGLLRWRCATIAWRWSMSAARSRSRAAGPSSPPSSSAVPAWWSMAGTGSRSCRRSTTASSSATARWRRRAPCATSTPRCGRCSIPLADTVELDLALLRWQLRRRRLGGHDPEAMPASRRHRWRTMTSLPSARMAGCACSRSAREVVQNRVHPTGANALLLAGLEILGHRRRRPAAVGLPHRSCCRPGPQRARHPGPRRRCLRCPGAIRAVEFLVDGIKVGEATAELRDPALDGPGAWPRRDAADRAWAAPVAASTTSMGRWRASSSSSDGVRIGEATVFLQPALGPRRPRRAPHHRSRPSRCGGGSLSSDPIKVVRRSRPPARR